MFTLVTWYTPLVLRRGRDFSHSQSLKINCRSNYLVYESKRELLYSSPSEVISTHFFTHFSPRSSLDAMFPLSWEAVSLSEWCWHHFSNVSKKFARCNIKYCFLLSCVSFPPPDLDRKWWELPHAWNLVLSAQSRKGAAAEFHLCIALFSNVQWHHLQMHLKNTFNKMCSEKKKLRIFSFLLCWELLDTKDMKSWIIWHLQESTILTLIYPELCVAV